MADPVPPAGDNLPPAAPPKKGGIGCLGILAIVAGVFAVLLLILGIFVWQAISWFKNSPEPTIAIGPPLNLSEGEKEDVDRILKSFDQAKKDKTNIDETVTTRVVNGFIEWVIQEESKNNKRKPEDALAMRGEFKGDLINLRFSIPAKDESGQIKQNMYINVDADLDVEIVDGEFTKLEVKRVALGGKEAPLLARAFINSGVMATKEAAKQAKADPSQHPDNPMRAIKLFKREGDRLHVILDGGQLKD